ncbi:ABC transporter substrate-binding protein [Mesorhizobium loti]|uniref:ABC transporter substrate-binding protein n=1 Tax=Rhizobium loti TaxID=381 RepID=UPI00047DF54F|nr:ABC transporter substrate-binding protein [Mesorhizobium loti]
MVDGRQVHGSWTWAIALMIGAIVSGCQSKSGVSDTLDPAAIAATPAPAGGAVIVPAKGVQSLGTGPTKITMLLPLSAPGTTGETGRKMLDGAKLAMADLGDKLLTLTVEDTKGDSTFASELAMKAITTDAKAVIGPVELPSAQHLAKLSGSKHPPVLALADDFAGAPGVYAVRLSEADSAAAGAAGLAAKGRKKFVLLVAAGPDAATVEKRVANGLSIYGAALAVTIPYSASDGGTKVVDDMQAVVDAPDAIIIASGGASPSAILAALKSKGIPGKATAVVGTNRWLEHSLEPGFEGAYIATLDASETGPIADRFKSTYNYPADTDVAYAYDMVALTAGIASSVGPDGFSRQVLENRSGFRGSTGLFRFRTDGASERSMPFYQVQQGALKLVEKSISGY